MVTRGGERASQNMLHDDDGGGGDETRLRILDKYGSNVL